MKKKLQEPLLNPKKNLASVKEDAAKAKPPAADSSVEKVLSDAKKDGVSADDSDESMPMDKDGKRVAIEKFTVIEDEKSDDLLVSFDIRNISKSKGDVSGRIFTILRPETGAEARALISPAAASIKNGLPAEYKKGQYFSIAHFKPVKFRVRNTQGHDFYKTASIYIYSNDGRLIFQKKIRIKNANTKD